MRLSSPFLHLTLLACKAAAHGYINDGRANLCRDENSNRCGSVRYEPQSLEANPGSPLDWPQDGQIASAGLVKFSDMNFQTSDLWSKVPIDPGAETISFEWTFTAIHRTRQYQYYLTNEDWDPDDLLRRSSFEATPFCVVEVCPEATPDDQCPLPDLDAGATHVCNDLPPRTGYQIVLALWEISDTDATFFNVVDLAFDSLVNTQTNTLAFDSASSQTFDTRTKTLRTAKDAGKKQRKGNYEGVDAMATIGAYPGNIDQGAVTGTVTVENMPSGGIRFTGVLDFRNTDFLGFIGGVAIHAGKSCEDATKVYNELCPWNGRKVFNSDGSYAGPFACTSLPMDITNPWTSVGGAHDDYTIRVDEDGFAYFSHVVQGEVDPTAPGQLEPNFHVGKKEVKNWDVGGHVVVVHFPYDVDTEDPDKRIGCGVLVEE
mmetsp:Transcript_52531/g.105260  ORF Transcript_52531/g.105260 Transcript_52531/m.105260 type:complete len:430 (-) Transcript_52531:15-1304(-)